MSENLPTIAAIVSHACSDVDQGKVAFDSDEPARRAAVILGPPTLSWVAPVREAIDWDRQLPAFILSHRVADFDTWLTGYDAVGQLQKSKGIIAQVANCSLDDPSW